MHKDKMGVIPTPTSQRCINLHLPDCHRLRKQLVSIARRAGVSDVHPHRFRHTFAIFYLRNGGDPYSLQIILGHSTMEMVKKYLAIARADIDAFHRSASPVANMRL